MNHNIKLYLLFFRKHLMSLMEYKADFLIGVVSYVFRYIGEIAMISLLFSKIKALAGWSFHEVLFIYGFAAIPRALNLLLFDNIWLLPTRYVQEGELDRLLVRPVNTFFHLLGEKFGYDGFGILGLALLIIGYAGSHLPIAFGIGDYLIMTVFALCGGLVYMATNLMAASLAFYFTRVQEVMQLIWGLNLFGTYPINIFIKPIRFVILFVIPFAYTGFVPAAFFLRREKFLPLALLGIPVSILFALLAYLFFKRGLKRYSSTGS